MREIIFRAQMIGSKEWTYGGTFCDEKDAIITSRKEMKLVIYVVYPNTVGQYTGLNDMDGKRIFEGDIIIITESDGPQVVCFRDGYFGWGEMHDGYYSFDPFILEDKIKIIGNIHDNPELMEGCDD